MKSILRKPSRVHLANTGYSAVQNVMITTIIGVKVHLFSKYFVGNKHILIHPCHCSSSLLLTSPAPDGHMDIRRGAAKDPHFTVLSLTLFVKTLDNVFLSSQLY